MTPLNAYPGSAVARDAEAAARRVGEEVRGGDIPLLLAALAVLHPAAAHGRRAVHPRPHRHRLRSRGG